jgi:hypothetical protein
MIICTCFLAIVQFLTIVYNITYMTKQKLWNNLTRLFVYIVSVVVSNLTYGGLLLFIYATNIQALEYNGYRVGFGIDFNLIDNLRNIILVLLFPLIIFILNPLPLYLLLSFIVKRVKKHLRNKSKV